MPRIRFIMRFVLLIMVASLLAPLAPPAVVTAAPYDPQRDFTLTDLGFTDQVLRGSSASLEMYFPGPGRFRVGQGNQFILNLSHAEILDPLVSTVTVLVNNVPLKTWFLSPETAAQRELAISIPQTIIQPDINLVALRFIMRLPREGCADTEHPALSATIYRQSRLHYDFLDGFPRTPPGAPDLGRFPLTLLEPSTIVPDRLTMIVPDSPVDSDLRAVMNVSASVGRFTSGRPVAMQLQQVKDALNGLSDTHLVMVGNPQTNALWDSVGLRELAKLPIFLYDRQIGQFRGAGGRDVDANEGVLMDVLSPWNPDQRLILVTGQNDEALVRASSALSSLTARQSLFGDAAVITERPEEIAPENDTARRDTLTDFTLADLGEGDRTVSGWGTHTLTVSFDSSGAPDRGATASIVYDHSRLINSGLSSLAVTLNDVPLLDTRLSTDRAVGRQTLEVPLPSRVLRPGRNALLVRFYFAQVGGINVSRPDSVEPERFPICGTSPTELSWGVLYSDSSIHLPPGAGGSAGLGSLPFPFIREGSSAGMLIVLPDDMRDAVQAPGLAAEFGRSVRTDVLDFAVTTYSRLTEEQRRDNNLVVFGTPAANPLIGELGPSLPLQMDERGRVVQGPGAPLAGVRDGATLGILQTIPSPFNPARAILTVTATNADGLELALRGLRQGGLRGNLATIQAPEQDTIFLRLRTFDVPIARNIAAPAITVQEAAPNLLAIVVAAGTVFLLAATAGSMVLASRRRATRVVATTTEAVLEEEDWMAGLESTLPRSR